MPQVRIYASRHEPMRRLLPPLYVVVEVRPRSDHGRGADGLTSDHSEQARGQEYITQKRRQPAPMREEEIGEYALEEGGRVGDIVRGAVLGEEERGDLGGARVVVRGSPELKEVKEAEDTEEERCAPESGRLCEDGIHGEVQGEDEDTAEKERSCSYSRERLGMAGEVLRVVGVEGGGEIALVRGCWRIGHGVAEMTVGCSWSRGAWHGPWRRPRVVLMIVAAGRAVERSCRWLHGRGGGSVGRYLNFGRERKG